MPDRIHRPTLLKVREMIQRDLELAEGGERGASLMAQEVRESMRQLEQARSRVFRGQLADIDLMLTKAEDF